MSAVPRYRQLADHYRHAIASGVLAPGIRMPSVRELMCRHKVSLSTALQAYRQLETDGLLEAKPRSGYFVRQPNKVRLEPVEEPAVTRFDPAQYVGINAKVCSVIAEGRKRPVKVDLAGACGAPELYPFDALRRAAIRALRRHPALFSNSVIQNGNVALRKVIAQYALNECMRLSADEVIITHGCTEALSISLRAVAQPGDVIAVESPTYYGLLQIIESLGLRAIEIPSSPLTGISIEALELASHSCEAIKAIVVIPNLQNPLGSVMPDSHKEQLVQWCETRGIPLIEDDTYTALIDDDRARTAAKAWDTSGNVILCSTLHKILAPGMRVGWIIGGKWQARIEMLKYCQSRPNETLSQLAIADFMASGELDRHLRRLRARLLSQRNHAADAIASRFPAGTRLCIPRGGVNLWVELPGKISSQSVFDLGLANGIRVAPGLIFSNSNRFDHFLRINCGAPYSRELDRAYTVLASIVTRLHETGGKGGER